MGNDYQKLLEHISALICTRAGYFDQLTAYGVDQRLWPNGEAKTLVEAYISLAKNNNHEYALFKLGSAVWRFSVSDDLPVDPSSLATLYWDLKRQHRVEWFVGRTASERDPEKIMELCREYITLQTKPATEFEFKRDAGKFIKDLEDDISRGVVNIKIPGWELLSELVGGFNPGRIGILLAETGFGKTTLALSLATSCAREWSTLFINMEMYGKDIFAKMISSLGGVSYKHYQSQFYNYFPQIQKAIDSVDKKLFFTDGSTMTIEGIEAIVKNKSLSDGIKFVFVDYDQKIDLHTSREAPEWKALQLAVIRLEALAKETGVFIFLLAQADSSGKVGASKRSVQPASLALEFKTHNGQDVLMAAKNRFGPHGHGVVVNFNRETGSVCEDRVVDKKFFEGEEGRRI